MKNPILFTQILLSFLLHSASADEPVVVKAEDAESAPRVLWWDDFESFQEGQLNISIVGGGPGPYDRQQSCQGFDHPGDPRRISSEATGKKSQIISREVAFNGSQSIKMQRNFGDSIPRPTGWKPRPPRKASPDATSARNELVTPELWGDGDDVWIGYSMFLASKPEYGANGRWRNTPGAKKTVLINQVTGGQPTFFFRINWDADGRNYFLNCDQTSSIPLLWDEWNSIVVRLLWKGIGGKVQVWQNGVQVIDVDHKHPQGGYNKFKFGQYGNTPAVGIPQIAFFDDLKIAVGTDLLDFVTPTHETRASSSLSGDQKNVK